MVMPKLIHLKGWSLAFLIISIKKKNNNNNNKNKTIVCLQLVYNVTLVLEMLFTYFTAQTQPMRLSM